MILFYYTRCFKLNNSVPWCCAYQWICVMFPPLCGLFTLIQITLHHFICWSMSNVSHLIIYNFDPYYILLWNYHFLIVLHFYKIYICFFRNKYISYWPFSENLLKITSTDISIHLHWMCQYMRCVCVCVWVCSRVSVHSPILIHEVWRLVSEKK